MQSRPVEIKQEFYPLPLGEGVVLLSFVAFLLCVLFLQIGLQVPWPWNITDVGFEFLILFLLPQSAEISGYASLCPVTILSLLYDQPLPDTIISRIQNGLVLVFSLMVNSAMGWGPRSFCNF